MKTLSHLYYYYLQSIPTYLCEVLTDAHTHTCVTEASVEVCLLALAKNHESHFHSSLLTLLEGIGWSVTSLESYGHCVSSLSDVADRETIFLAYFTKSLTQCRWVSVLSICLPDIEATDVCFHPFFSLLFFSVLQ